MSKHTPGPWSVHEWGKTCGTRFGIETADHRHGIASIAPNENASTLLTMDEHRQNAQLIAQAPRMLLVIQAIAEFWDFAEGEDEFSVPLSPSALIGGHFGEDVVTIKDVLDGILDDLGFDR